ncbi:25S rRNA (adenine2142-N1)-methyltransferase [Coemansia sp. RSA 1365]|nr:25S rRNA (adenine2142-N1)-methyltransferase [Coemansia sp. RSA 1365]
MPKAHTKRRRPVTALSASSGFTAPAFLPLPPIHTVGQKIVIDTAPLSKISRGKLGKSSTDTRRRINHFHTLIKEYSQLGAKRHELTNAQKISEVELRIEEVAREMAQMGGLDWYQKASLLGQSKQRGGDTSRWLVPKLRELKLHQRSQKLRLLDVGALSCLNYARERAWIDAVPIDLNSQEPGIIEQDFLDIVIDRKSGTPVLLESNALDDADADNDTDIPHHFETLFDVVCLSLVVNFIGDATRRGDMLRKASQLLVSGGYLFFVLPRACVTNSRYLDDERLQTIMQHLGFEQLFIHHTPKLAHYLYRLSASGRINDEESKHECLFKKKLLHSSAGRNNFAIVLQ